MTQTLDRRAADRRGSGLPASLSPDQLTSSGHPRLTVRGRGASRRTLADRALKVLLLTVMVLAAIPLLLIVIQVAQRGLGVISWEFLTQREAPPAREGGGTPPGSSAPGSWSCGPRSWPCPWAWLPRSTWSTTGAACSRP